MKGLFELAQSSPRRMAGFLLALVSFGSLVLLILFGRDVRHAEPAVFPRSVPDFVLRLDDGVRVSSRELLGTPTLLLFADPDCPIRTPGAVREMADLQPAIGLALLFPHAPLLVFTLLNDINLFDLWFVIVVARGLSSQGMLRPGGALCLSFGVWAFCVAAQLSFLAVLNPRT